MQSNSKEEGIRGVAQLASASGLGPEGPVFESQYPDKNKKRTDHETRPLFICFDYCSLKHRLHLSVHVFRCETELFIKDLIRCREPE